MTLRLALLLLAAGMAQADDAWVSNTLALVQQKMNAAYSEGYKNGFKDCTRYIISNYVDRIHVVTNTVYVTNECTRQHCSPTNMTCGAWKQMIYNDVTNAVEK